jgi:hypothetical protein
MKTIIKIGLIILAVMFIMKMMKGKRCEGFTQKQPNKVICNCNINQENFSSDWKEKQKIEDDEAKKHLEKLKKDSSIDTIDKYLSKIPDAPYTPIEGIPKPKYARTFCNFLNKNINYFIDLHKNMPVVFEDLKNKVDKIYEPNFCDNLNEINKNDLEIKICDYEKKAFGGSFFCKDDVNYKYSKDLNIFDFAKDTCKMHNMNLKKTFNSKDIEDKMKEFSDLLDPIKNPQVDYNKVDEIKKELKKLSNKDLKEYILKQKFCENIATEVATTVPTTPVPTTPVPTTPVQTTIPIQASTCNHQQCFDYLAGIDDIDWPDNLDGFKNLMRNPDYSDRLGICTSCLSDDDLETIFNKI